jgi:hypothetical protein
MKFLVTWKVFETLTQEQAKPLRGGLCPRDGPYVRLAQDQGRRGL